MPKVPVTRVQLIPRRCPPARCTACNRQITGGRKGIREAIQVSYYTRRGKWLDRDLYHVACYQGQYGEPERRTA
jgi:hypothetical protein